MGSECHYLLSFFSIPSVIFPFESDIAVVHLDQSAVGYGDPVRVARQVRQGGFWTGEGFLGVDNPVDLAQRFDEVVEDTPINQACMIAEELQPPALMQFV